MYECCRLTPIMGRVLILFYLVTLVPSEGNQTVWEHHCDPGSELFACSVATFIYKPGENHSRLIVPEGVRKVRLHYPLDKVSVDRDEILAYDRVLHAELNHPRAVQIQSSQMSLLEIPMDLEYADFNGNSIRKVIAPEPRDVEAEYLLRYLDLAGNVYLENIDNISVLVNLETLYLRANSLDTLDEKVFRRMTKLSTLGLARNHFVDFEFSMLPPSLVYLDLTSNYLITLHLSNVHLPALEILSLKRNDIPYLNVTTLRLAAPKLKEILISGNTFDYNEETALVAALQAAGIAYDDFEKGPRHTDLHFDELNYYIENDKRILRDVVFTLVIAAVNLSLVVWVGYRLWQMRKSTTDQTAQQ